MHFLLLYNNDLTANNKKYQASYQNGKYGFIINGAFYEIGGGSVKFVDVANKQKIDGISDPITLTKDSLLFVSCSITMTGDVTVDGVSIFSNSGVPGSTYGVTSIQLPLKAGQVITCTLVSAPNKAINAWVAPYFD